MRPTLVQHHAIEARIGMIVGSTDFDRLFSGIEFGDLEAEILYVFAKDEACAAEIEDRFSAHISIIASQILSRNILFVNVLPKQLSTGNWHAS